MNALVAYTINERNFILSPDRSLFWEKEKTLIIADLHIGKTGHFRKSGIAVPQGVFKEDLHRLFSQILYFKAEQLIIAGDLTHSRSNKELDLFKKWRQDLHSLKIFLVNGNHDILQQTWYDEVNITRQDKLQIGKFSFLHDPAHVLADGDHSIYSFCGHLHPCVSIKGKGRQSVILPCFYFKRSYAILPAFSRFSGMARIVPKQGENVFAVLDKGIMQVQ